jgi:FAD/FMN-containing dehydrogenase
MHYNPARPLDWSRERYVQEKAPINRIVHDIVVELGGSISAEHGIGRSRLAELAHYKAPVEIRMMRAVKSALDPHNLMNPGKVVPD